MVVVAVLLATACTVDQRVASRGPRVDIRASTTPAPSFAALSAGASTSPSASTARLAWSRASLAEDWPGPVRAEPAGGAKVVPILWTDDGETGRYQDPTGDTGSEAFAWVDIHAVSFCHNHECPVVWVPGPPNVNPTEQWIAYGLVAERRSLRSAGARTSEARIVVGQSRPARRATESPGRSAAHSLSKPLFGRVTGPSAGGGPHRCRA